MLVLGSCDTEAKRFAAASDRCALADTPYLPLHYHLDSLSRNAIGQQVTMDVYDSTGTKIKQLILPLDAHDAQTNDSSGLVYTGYSPSKTARVVLTAGEKRYVIEDMKLSPRPVGGNFNRQFPDCYVDSIRVNGTKIKITNSDHRLDL